MSFRLMFYVEPLTELNRPLFHSAWLEFAAKMAATLARGGASITADTFRLVTNSVMAAEGEKYGLSGDLVSVVNEAQMLENYQADYLEIMVKGYAHELSETELQGAADLTAEAAAPFQPDIVITFTTAPHLEVAFPDALILHMEYGLYSRPPYPESFYLDPFGKFKNNSIRLFSDEIMSRTPARDELKLVERVRSVFLDGIIKNKSPYKALETDLRTRFEKLILLPLQFRGHYGFEGTSHYQGQDELLEDVMNATPETVGVIALPHSTAIYIGDIPEPARLEALFRQFPNLTMHPNLSGIVHPSQFMLAHVDAVASVSSSVALQGLLWGMTIIALGNSHINAISDYEGVPALGHAPLEIDMTKRLPFLAWMLSHYYIPAPYLFEPSWLAPYLTQCLNKWRGGTRGLDYFGPIDMPHSIAEVVTSAAIHDVPIPSGKADAT